MPSDLSSYLATRYLTADPKPTKKRKRKQPGNGGATNEGLQITDDAESSWGARPSNADDGDEDGGGIGVSVAGTSAEFRKAKKSGWKVLGGAPSATTTTQLSQQAQTQPQKDDATAADAILASAAAESRRAADADAEDEAPAIMMSDGTHAGLQSAATVSAQLEKRRRAERAEFEATRQKHKEQETVYRDATGRRVDLAWKRAEARKAADEAREKEEEAKRGLRGHVQEREREARREMLLDAKTMGFARGADDVVLNEELKGERRWGDTMAAFVGGGDGGSGGGSGGNGGGKAGKGKRLKGRPVYQGAATPNRYGIRPGYRWDGVNRGNGFEGERFKAINRRERNKGLEYSWQMDE